MRDYKEYLPGPKEKTAVFLFTLAVMAGISYFFYDSLLLIILSPFIFPLVLKEYGRYMARKYSDRFREGFKDLLYSLASSFAGGRHMDEALKESYEDLGKVYEEDEIIMRELKAMNDSIADGGRVMGLLEDLDERTGSEDVSVFVEIYRCSRETGGDLVKVLSDTASMLGDKIKIEDEIRSMARQKKEEGIMIGVMPVLVLMFLRIVSPGYVSVLYHNLPGVILMTLAIAGMIYAYHLIIRITDIKV